MVLWPQQIIYNVNRILRVMRKTTGMRMFRAQTRRVSGKAGGAFVLILLAALLPVRPAKADIFEIFDTAITTIQSGFDYIWPDDLEVKDFSARVGFGLGAAPDYVGSDNYRFRIVPLIDLRYKDIWALQGTKLRVNVIRTGSFRAGPMANLMFGRDADRNAALDGLKTIKDTVQVGVFVEARSGSFLVNADIRKALGSRQGVTAQVTLAHGLYHKGKLSIGAALRAKWGSDRYIQTNFGITPAQSAASGHRIFNAKGGISTIGASFLARYQLTERIRWEAIAAGFLLVGDADDSPLVEDVGSPLQVLAGMGLRYTF